MDNKKLQDLANNLLAKNGAEYELQNPQGEKLGMVTAVMLDRTKHMKESVEGKQIAYIAGNTPIAPANYMRLVDASGVYSITKVTTLQPGTVPLLFTCEVDY